VLGCAIRLAIAVWAGVVPRSDTYYDAYFYHATAAGLANGRGYLNPYTSVPTVLWPPGYPLLLALGYRFWRTDPSWAFVLNALAGTMTCILTWRLARRVTTSVRALTALTFVALLPSQILFTGLVLSESVFTAAFLLLVTSAIVVLERPRAARAAAWGCRSGAHGARSR